MKNLENRATCDQNFICGANQPTPYCCRRDYKFCLYYIDCQKMNSGFPSLDNVKPPEPEKR